MFSIICGYILFSSISRFPLRSCPQIQAIIRRVILIIVFGPLGLGRDAVIHICYHAGYPSVNSQTCFPVWDFWTREELAPFYIMPEALHGMRSSPETGPRRAELVVGKNRNEVEIRSKSPGAAKLCSG